MPPESCPFCRALNSKHLPRCPIGTGGFVLKEDGSAIKRQRTIHRVINLDVLDETRLQMIVGLWPIGDSRGAFARKLYPGRPRGYLTVAPKLYAMARLRLMGDTSNYERIYRTLPEWAQWRQHFANVQKAVAPGKQFRKRPPRKTNAKNR